MTTPLSLLLLLAFALLGDRRRLAAALASTGSSPASSLSFEVGGTALTPQDLPPFLHDYHHRALKLTEEALADASLRCQCGVPYGTEPHQLLDVWTPAAAVDGPIPVVVFFHGGGWDWGYREWAGFAARHICSPPPSRPSDGVDDATPPAVFVTPSYAISEGKGRSWPNSRDDVLAALRWVTENVSTYGGDPTRVVLAGHSAGGHLASSVGLDPTLLRSGGVDPRSIRGLFLLSAPLGLTAPDFCPRRWMYRFPLTRPLIGLLYRRAILPVLRPVVGDGAEPVRDRVEVAREASPLDLLASSSAKVGAAAAVDEDDDMADDDDDYSGVYSPLVHYTYGAKGDFFTCRPHVRRLRELLGDDRVRALELPVEGHFETHFALADGECEWYESLREVLRS